MRLVSSLQIAFLALISMLAIGCGGPPEAVSLTPTKSRYTTDLEHQFNQATALLYARVGEDGKYVMVCTTTAFEYTGLVYRFVTAAHCVGEDNVKTKHVELAPVDWFISFDERGKKEFIPAKILRAGYQSRGDDFAVLEVTLDRQIPTVPVAAKDPSLGEPVCNIASPLGLGKQLFRGHVSMEQLDRPVVDEGLNWRDTTLLQISSGPGSSGSAIVSTSQGAIVAFLVGRISNRGSSNIVSIPASKFKRFNQLVASKQYPWYDAKNAGTAETLCGKDTAAILRILQRVQSHTLVYKDSASLLVPLNE